MIRTKQIYPRTTYLSLNPFELHKHLINTYVLDKKGNTAYLKRDTSRDKRDIDIIKENHKFLWEENDVATTWEERLAKKYYDKLFKEFCITDLSRYKENKYAMRWQTENELLSGKGQFICGNKTCTQGENLRTWEVNFAYNEKGEKKNALVKLRLCESCSKKLNYHHKKKEIKRFKSNKNRKVKQKEIKKDVIDVYNEEKLKERRGELKGDKTDDKVNEEEGTEIWTSPIEEPEDMSREEEFEKYIEHLLL